MPVECIVGLRLYIWCCGIIPAARYRSDQIAFPSNSRILEFPDRHLRSGPRDENETRTGSKGVRRPFVVSDTATSRPCRWPHPPTVRTGTSLVLEPSTALPAFVYGPRAPSVEQGTIDLLPRLKTRESRHGISGRVQRPCGFKTHTFQASTAGFQHRLGCLVARSNAPHPQPSHRRSRVL